MLPIERKFSKGARDEDFLVLTDDRPRHAADAQACTIPCTTSSATPTSGDAVATAEGVSAFASASASVIPLVVVLDHLRSAFNVGAIFRTAECLGVERLVLCGYTATPDDAQAPGPPRFYVPMLMQNAWIITAGAKESALQALRWRRFSASQQASRQILATPQYCVFSRRFAVPPWERTTLCVGSTRRTLPRRSQDCVQRACRPSGWRRSTARRSRRTTSSRSRAARCSSATSGTACRRSCLSTATAWCVCRASDSKTRSTSASRSACVRTRLLGSGRLHTRRQMAQHAPDPNGHWTFRGLKLGRHRIDATHGQSIAADASQSQGLGQRAASKAQRTCVCMSSLILSTLVIESEFSSGLVNTILESAVTCSSACASNAEALCEMLQIKTHEIICDGRGQFVVSLSYAAVSERVGT
eukprot:6177970-Pleurochrysis_carterae.AAC.1